MRKGGYIQYIYIYIYYKFYIYIPYLYTIGRCLSKGMLLYLANASRWKHDDSKSEAETHLQYVWVRSPCTTDAIEISESQYPWIVFSGLHKRGSITIRRPVGGVNNFALWQKKTHCLSGWKLPFYFVCFCSSFFRLKHYTLCLGNTTDRQTGRPGLFARTYVRMYVHLPLRTEIY